MAGLGDDLDPRLAAQRAAIRPAHSGPGSGRAPPRRTSAGAVIASSATRFSRADAIELEDRPLRAVVEVPQDLRRRGRPTGRRGAAAACRLVNPIASSPSTGVRHMRATQGQRWPGSVGSTSIATSRSIRVAERERDRAPVVGHEAHALDAEVIEEGGQERGVALERVRPVGGLAGLAEAGQVDRDPARALEERRPQVGRVRHAVHVQHRRVARTARAASSPACRRLHRRARSHLRQLFPIPRSRALPGAPRSFATVPTQGGRRHERLLRHPARGSSQLEPHAHPDPHPRPDAHQHQHEHPPPRRRRRRRGRRGRG